MTAIAANLKLCSRRKGVGIREYAERLCVGPVESWSQTANIERPQMADIGAERKASAGQHFHQESGHVAKSKRYDPKFRLTMPLCFKEIHRESQIACRC